jgi:molybdate transport system permease protein
MDWPAFRLSLWLGFGTVVILLPFALWLGRFLALRRFRGRGLVEAAVALPLVLPPTVLGFYLLTTFGAGSWLGSIFQAVFGKTLAFSFEGLLLASAIANIPFAVQPIQNAFAAIPPNLREAGATSGMAPWEVFWRVELPLAWPGIATAIADDITRVLQTLSTLPQVTVASLVEDYETGLQTITFNNP